MKRLKKARTLFTLAGFAFVVASAFLISTWLGLLIVGLIFLLVGFALDKATSKQTKETKPT